MPAGIFALDLAKAIGWASASKPAVEAWPLTELEWQANGVPEGVQSGFHILRDQKVPGALLAEFNDWLLKKVDEFDPAIIIFEANAAFGKNTSSPFLRRALGLAGICEAICARRSIRAREISPQTVKARFAGHGRATKDMMIAEARHRGFDVYDDNEADAIGILDSAILQIRGVMGKSE